jgi:hypothetical protein
MVDALSRPLATIIGSEEFKRRVGKLTCAPMRMDPQKHAAFRGDRETRAKQWAGWGEGREK